MNKLLSISVLITTIIFSGCKHSSYLAQAEKLQEMLTTMTFSYKDNLKVCVDDNCDVKTRFYINELELLDPNTHFGLNGDGRYIFKITGEACTDKKTYCYIGISLTDWEDFDKKLEDLDDFKKEQEIRKFFQANFDKFGFLVMGEKVMTTPTTTDEPPVWTGNYYFKDAYGNDFSLETDLVKDLEGIGALVEAERFENLSERLEASYGLSSDRAKAVAKNISAYNKLSSKRSLTKREQNQFSKELLGVDYNNARDAFLSGDKKDLDSLLEVAADVNETSPEQVSAIINELFL